MKILSIGNSFSQDAQRWLHDMAVAAGLDITTTNLYIGGCSLKQHAENISKDAADYDREVNGGSGLDKISITQALKMDDWDVITLQQASHDSGRPQTYFPYLMEVYNHVKSICPKAKVYIHETWSYELDTQHWAFPSYNRDQDEMYRRLHDCYEMASIVTGAPLIPSGTVVQTLRHDCKAFHYRQGGLSLCRDTFHMSLDYGRYAVAATWIVTLTGADLRKNTFVPQGEGIHADPKLLSEIQNVIYDLLIAQKQ